MLLLNGERGFCEQETYSVPEDVVPCPEVEEWTAQKMISEGILGLAAEGAMQRKIKRETDGT